MAGSAPPPRDGQLGISAPSDSPAIEKPSETPATSPSSSFMKRGYPRSQHPKFFAAIEELLPRAKKIKLIATGLKHFFVRERPDVVPHLVEATGKLIPVPARPGGLRS